MVRPAKVSDDLLLSPPSDFVYTHMDLNPVVGVFDQINGSCDVMLIGGLIRTLFPL